MFNAMFSKMLVKIKLCTGNSGNYIFKIVELKALEKKFMESLSLLFPTEHMHLIYMS